MFQINNQLVLDEEYDENYQPTEEEVYEYAQVIGIDPLREPELLYIARQGIVAPLPNDWKPCQDPSGDIYYFNFSTGDSVWDHPCDEHFRELVEKERMLLRKKSLEKKKVKKNKDQKTKKENFGTLAPLKGESGPQLSSLKSNHGKLGSLLSTGNPLGVTLQSNVNPLAKSGIPSKIGLTADLKNPTKINNTETKTNSKNNLRDSFAFSLGKTGENVNFEMSDLSEYSDGKPKFTLGLHAQDIANLSYDESDDDNQRSADDKDDETELDFGINSGLAARLEGMTIENLPRYNMSNDDDDSDSKSYKFDIKNSFNEDKLRQEVLKIKQSNEKLGPDQNLWKNVKLMNNANFQLQSNEGSESYANSNSIDDENVMILERFQKGVDINSSANLETQSKDLKYFKEKLMKEETEEKEKLDAQFKADIAKLRSEHESKKLDEEKRLKEELNLEVQKLKAKYEIETKNEENKIKVDHQSIITQLKNKLDLEMQQFTAKLKEDKDVELKRLKAEDEKEIEKHKSNLKDSLLKFKEDIEKQNELDKKSLQDNLEKEKRLMLDNVKKQFEKETEELRSNLFNEHNLRINSLKADIEGKYEEDENIFKDSLNQSKFAQISGNMSYINEAEENHKYAIKEMNEKHSEEIRKLSQKFIHQLEEIKKEFEEKVIAEKTNGEQKLSTELKEFQKYHQNEIEQQNQQHEAKLNLLRSTFNKQNEELEEKTKNLEKISSDIQEKKEKLIGLENDLRTKKESITNELNELNKKTSEVSKANRNKEHDINLLSIKKQQFQNEISNLMENEVSLRETIGMLQTSKSVLEGNLSELMEKKNNILDKIKEENEIFLAQQHQHEDLVLDLKSQVKNLQDFLQTLENEKLQIKGNRKVQCIDVSTNTDFVSIKPESDLSQSNVQEMLNEDRKSPLSLKDLQKEAVKEDAEIKKNGVSSGGMNNIKNFKNIQSRLSRRVWLESDSESLQSTEADDYEKYARKLKYGSVEDSEEIQRAQLFLLKNRESLRQAGLSKVPEDQKYIHSDLHKRLSPSAAKVLKRVRMKLAQERAEIDEAISSITEQYEEVHNDERVSLRTKIPEDFIDVDNYIETISDADYVSNRRDRLKQMRDQRYRLYEKLDYQPWIENITANNRDNFEDDFTYVRRKIDKKRFPMNNSDNKYEDETRYAYPAEIRHNIPYEGQRKSHLEHNDESFFVKTIPTPTVEERLEMKWRKYFGDRQAPSYQSSRVSWGHASALENLRNSGNTVFNGQDFATERRLQSHAEWLKSLSKSNNFASLASSITH
ncbi:centrosomal protein of 164 kDa isoform X6 [Hydra vulgaris]|uniref:Centrosomal protein of 164 kDa isoform X6 n=1 Tax=Hydra vulgaris TaxID=6087 RepID=A0ABM4B7B7_HYDVU